MFYVMKYIVKLFPEITIKSNSVRLRFIKILSGNIRNILKQHDMDIAVVRHWDYIEVRPKDASKIDDVGVLLTRIPGIHHILAVNESTYESIHDIYEQSAPYFIPLIENKTFCVRVKRRGKQSFTSLDVEKYVGGELNQAVSSATVKLSRPEFTVHLEIDNDKLLLIKKRLDGLGGFPIGAQEDVLSLISGGFDSSISSYMLMRRGCRVHYCFFNLGGSAHEIGVKQMAHYLWHRFGSSHKVRFISIDFAHVVGEILEKVDDGQMGVILKRMMIRAASMIANKYGIQALVTGEALGQVSSQTLTNLRLIDNVTDSLILRPLITHDKQDIINLTREIGTDIIAKTMPEFCGVISKNPTVKAIKEKIEHEESLYDFSILESAVNRAQNIDIREIAAKPNNSSKEVVIITEPNQTHVVIDVRAPDEQEHNPLLIENIKTIHIPFYKLSTYFPDLDQSKYYLFYCDKGIMSKLQALYLMEQGFSNVGIFKRI